MAENCNIKNPLLRDGTSQQQRLLKALLPSYVSVDERSMQDLITFTENFSKDVLFYQDDNTVPSLNGNWQSFFKNQFADIKAQNTQPHYALFLAFLELFKIAQDDLNTITARHLDFYYKEVLQLKEYEAVPDQVFVIFALAQNFASHLVVKNSALDAKKDSTNTDLIYDTTSNLVVNKAKIKELKALYYNKNNNNRLYASPIANSADGQGQELEGDEKKWSTFGSISDPTLPLNSPLIKQKQAEIGFAFSSPILFLAEGERVITIELSLDNTNGLNNTNLSNAFKILFSGAEEWITVLPDNGDNTSYVDSVNGKIIIHRKLTIEQAAVVSYNDEVLKGGFVTEWPVVKILLNTDDDSTVYIYKQLKGLSVKSAKITVDVQKVKNLLLQNDQSVLDASKPFQPFGNRPVLGSDFYVGSAEAFSKNVSSVNLHIDWLGLPKDNNGFVNYYKNYIPNVNRGNSAFRASISILDNKVWKTLIPSSSDTSRLFSGADGTPVLSTRDINITSGALAQVSKVKGTILPLTELDHTTQRGFLRLQLQGSDFGHSDFQNSFATQAMKAAIPVTVKLSDAGELNERSLDSARRSASDSASDVVLTVPGVNFNPLPNEPYTPLISNIYLDYQASVEIELIHTPVTTTSAAYNTRVDKYYHIEPFGVAEYHPFLIKTINYTPLLPEYNDEGTLYIGLSDLEPSQIVSVLFKVAEGTANPDLPKQTLKWSYMADNEWYRFAPLKVISDTTNSFLTSGIVQFDISKKATNTNTVLPAGMHWIKASVEQDALAVCDMIDIQAQAVLAQFKDNNNDPAHYSASLPANTINALVDGDSAIEKVEQPYSSFGGKTKEQSDAFYTRISERLRHKNRAVTLWDYEHLVLEKFPSIYKVKCITHAAYNSLSDFNEMAPGHVSLVTVSNVRNQNAVDPLRPKTSLITLNSINEYLSSITPPFVKLHVKNPVYEEIRMDFTVRFYAGFDNDFYRNKLDEDLRKFLAPWAYSAVDISFGGVIHKSVILKFVEDQEYVDFVTCFRMDHLYPGGALLDIEEAKTITSASILTSAPAHTIQVLETDDCGDCKSNIVGQPFDPVDDSCDCNDHEAQKGSYGIGAFIIDKTFIVGNGTAFTEEGIGTEEVGNLEIT